MYIPKTKLTQVSKAVFRNGTTLVKSKQDFAPHLREGIKEMAMKLGDNTWLKNRYGIDEIIRRDVTKVDGKAVTNFVVKGGKYKFNAGNIKGMREFIEKLKKSHGNLHYPDYNLLETLRKARMEEKVPQIAESFPEMLKNIFGALKIKK